MIKTIYSRHTLAHCYLCGYMIRCATCNNNCCNGTYGQVSGKDCPDCPEAYEHQDRYYKNESSIRFSKFEKKKLAFGTNDELFRTLR